MAKKTQPVKTPMKPNTNPAPGKQMPCPNMPKPGGGKKK